MFEFFFKYPAAAYERGKIVLAGGWPLWLLIAAMVGGAACIGFLLYRRRHEALIKGYRQGVIWALQSALLALLLLMLWQPALSVSALKAQQNVVAVIVDDSKSMGLVEDGSSRREKAVKALDDGLLKDLREKFQVRLYRTGERLKKIEKFEQLSSSDRATRLADSMKEVVAEAGSLPIGAVVLVSDGAENSGGIDLETIQEIRRHQIPVHTIGVGREKLVKDVELSDAQTPAKALQDSRLSAVVTFRQYGYTGQKGRLVLREGGKVVASQEVVFKQDGAEQTESALFNAGSPGAKNLELSIDPLAGEENTQNNKLTRVFDVSNNKPRVLYIEGEPRWEFKFIRRAMEEDKTMELVTLLRTTPNKFYRQGIGNPKELENGFPTTVDDLFGYQAIVLGTVEAAWFTPTQQELIHRFVDKRGGGLIFLAGRASFSDGGFGREPFTPMLPVTIPDRKGTFHRDPATAELTVAGRDSLICRIEENPDRNMERWKKLPYILGYQEIGIPKPGALTLAEMTAGGNARMPLLVTQNYGRGRTAAFAGAGTWRWQMLQPLADKSHETFWQQFLRWSVTGTPTQVQSSLSKSSLSDESKIRFRAEVRDKSYSPAGDANVVARIIGPSGAGSEVTMTPVPTESGVFEAEYNAEREGSYVVEMVAHKGTEELGRDVATFRREDGVAENFHVEQNRELLEKLAQQTGGTYRGAADARKLGSDISYSDAGITMRETKDLWNMPLFFLLALALRGSEWMLRRRWGVI
jgi:uncharacterized membrane protein